MGITVIKHNWNHSCGRPEKCCYLGDYSMTFGRKVDLYVCKDTCFCKFGSGPDDMFSVLFEEYSKFLKDPGRYVITKEYFSWMAPVIEETYRRYQANEIKSGFCSKCKHEIKERELFFSKAICCMC